MYRLFLSAILCIILAIGFTSVAVGATKARVTFDVTNTNFNVKSSNKVTVNIKNGNSKEEVAVDVQPQRYSKGAWKDTDSYDYDFINPYRTYKSVWSMKDFGKVAGTYRYKVTVYKFDKFGFPKSQGHGYTKTFKIKK